MPGEFTFSQDEMVQDSGLIWDRGHIFYEDITVSIKRHE